MLHERGGGHSSFRTLHNTLANVCVYARAYVNMFVQNKTRKTEGCAGGRRGGGERGRTAAATAARVQCQRTRSRHFLTVDSPHSSAPRVNGGGDGGGDGGIVLKCGVNTTAYCELDNLRRKTK